MKSVFKNLGYTTSTDTTTGKPLKLIIINNTDGTPRWLCPANAPKPYFLKFYNTSSWSAQLFSTLVKFIFFVGLQRIIFKDTQLYIEAADKPIIDIFQNNWAVFMGTIGPNKKALAYQEDASGSRFFKIATTKKAEQLIAHEASTTETLVALQVDSFQIPHCQTFSSTVIELEDISENGKRCNEFTAAHLTVLNELYAKTTIETKIDCKDRIIQLLNLNDARIPKGILKKLILLQNNIKNTPIKVAQAHGDFTPWNMYVKEEGLAIYDWELARNNMPLGFDAYHFIMQQGILVKRSTWNDIKECIQAKINPAAFSKWTQGDGSTWEDYFKWYLFINISEHLVLYSQQEEWHPQIEWLLHTWNIALSDILQEKIMHRKMLIMDVLDYLHNKKYAAMKFPNLAPEQLSEYSDIDLCIEKKDLAGIIAYLKPHPIVQHIIVKRKSFMASIQLFLKDGSILCLDLIWKIQRKALTILDAKIVLKRAWRNDYGVKQMHIKDLAQYVGLFYGLNKKTIPPKFKNHILALSVCKQPLDQCLYKHFYSRDIPTQKLNSILKEMPYNNLFSRAWNSLMYFSDTLRQFLFSKGMVITFSGVDGAGKSTVIETIKQEIEKKMRQPVIVLRHRPSILPILSAWTKGKAQAEQDAANRLPRKGNNQSKIGSVLRFAYYYTDYLFGQFYIYFKYVRRGHILLYDRYYFDFINDSKRSNIELPTGLARFGYHFLMQPDLNFFLYADADTILERKQELDKTTIEQLTNQYLDLFEELNKKGKKRYFAIENTTLSNTIDFIYQKTKNGLVI